MRWRVVAAGDQSLGTRLSRWLALQGLVAALAVSGTVYAVNLWVLQSRQHEELALKSAVVRHALAEAAGTSAAEELQHKLKDFLAGHEDMTLSITSREGLVLFRAPPHAGHGDEGSNRRFKQSSWDDTWLAGTGGGVRVVLGLDVTRDLDLLQRLGWILLAASLVGAGLVSVTGYRPSARRLCQREQQLAAHQFVQGQRIGDRASGSLGGLERRVRQVLEPGVGVLRKAVDTKQVASADFVPRFEVTLPGTGEQLDVLSPHVVVLFFRARMRRPERQLVRVASRAHHFAVRKR